MDQADRSQLIKYLKQNGLWAKKSLGQNFLVDRGVLDKIVAAAELKKSDTVLEIGPGLGTLTQELVKRAGKVIAVEKDGKLVELLKSQITNHKSQTNSKLENSNKETKLQIVKGDILDLNVGEIIKCHPDSPAGEEGSMSGSRIECGMTQTPDSSLRSE